VSFGDVFKIRNNSLKLPIRKTLLRPTNCLYQHTSLTCIVQVLYI